MTEDLQLLRRAIEEPVHQMLLAEVSSPQHALRLAKQIRDWGGSSRPIKTSLLDANHDNARNFYDSCQQLASGWSEDDEPPGLLLLIDQSVPDVRIAHPTAQQPTSVGFWRTMNLLREGWNDLPCQTVFLVTPQQYHLFSTEADHLKRWIPLKLHIEESESAPPQPRRERGIIELNKEELRPKFAGQDDLDNRDAAKAQWESLRQREFLALERGDKPETIARRQRLPLFAAAITLERWDDAARYNAFLKEVQLPLNDELRRLNLEMFFQQGRGYSQQAEEVAKSAIDLAMEQGEERDQLMAKWALGKLYNLEKRWDEHENVLQQLLTLSPRNADVLADYADFLAHVKGQYDRAEAFYKRSIEINPKRAATLGNYANLLTNERGDHDRAEELYERVIEIDPTRFITLGNYANFLTGVRGDNDRAEELYTRSVEINSKYAISLCNYATFLRNVRGDLDRAEEYYERAIRVAENDALILGNYAIFLAYARNKPDEAEKFYKRSIEANIRNATSHSADVISNYAAFLTEIRDDHNQAEELYERAIEIDPNHAKTLANYADFLSEVRSDNDRADEFFERAVEIDPAQCSRYAVHLCLKRNEYDRAEPYFRKALEAAPNDIQNVINAAAFFLGRGNREEGRELLDKALATKNLQEPQRVALAFHRYIHFPREEPESLGQLKKLLKAGERARNWSFDLNIKRARKDKHPNTRLLSALAQVVSGEKELKILNQFPEWAKA